MKKLIIAAIMFSLLYVSIAGASVECLSGDAARKAFVDEKTEPYFSLLQPREMAAKAGGQQGSESLQRQREKLRSTYISAVLECTDEDRKGLESYIKIIDSSIKPTYPGLVAMPWRFVKVKNEIEGGLPHTRADVIVFSASVLNSLAESAQRRLWRMEYINMIIHEQLHVIQRVKSTAFATLYEQQWGFHKAAAISGSDHWLATHQIVNPDGVDVLWIWPVPGTTRVIWPRVILAGENPAPTMPDDFEMIGIELVPTATGYAVATDKKDRPRYKNILDEAAYMKKFIGISSLYHPNEIAADFITDLALWDCLIDKRKTSPEQVAAMESRFIPLRKWAQQTFAH